MSEQKQEKQKTPRGTARRLRREAGNYKPVNPAASLAQAPHGRFAREGGTVQDQPQVQA